MRDRGVADGVQGPHERLLRRGTLYPDIPLEVEAGELVQRHLLPRGRLAKTPFANRDSKLVGCFFGFTPAVKMAADVTI